jgi:hypothetical protein
VQAGQCLCSALLVRRIGSRTFHLTILFDTGCVAVMPMYGATANACSGPVCEGGMQCVCFRLQRHVPFPAAMRSIGKRNVYHMWLWREQEPSNAQMRHTRTYNKMDFI